MTGIGFVFGLAVMFVAYNIQSVKSELNDYNFSHNTKNTILSQLKKGPQSVTGNSEEFLKREALSDPRVIDFLKDVVYETYCCAYGSDLNQFPYHFEITMTFIIRENNQVLSVLYDLDEEKVTKVERGNLRDPNPLLLN